MGPNINIRILLRALYGIIREPDPMPTRFGHWTLASKIPPSVSIASIFEKHEHDHGAAMQPTVSAVCSMPHYNQKGVFN